MLTKDWKKIIIFENRIKKICFPFFKFYIKIIFFELYFFVAFFDVAENCHKPRTAKSTMKSNEFVYMSEKIQIKS